MLPKLPSKIGSWAALKWRLQAAPAPQHSQIVLGFYLKNKKFFLRHLGTLKNSFSKADKRQKNRKRLSKLSVYFNEKVDSIVLSIRWDKFYLRSSCSATFQGRWSPCRLFSSYLWGGLSERAGGLGRVRRVQMLQNERSFNSEDRQSRWVYCKISGQRGRPP